jgi:YVTN family beta-propeller protein
MTELPTGSLLAGCRIEGVVGRGGMGVVYRATQLSLDRPVALKVIAPEFAGDVTFRERFKRESRIAASIEHPNVIPVYEAGEGEGVLYLIMRYVEGTDLRAVIDAEEGGLDAERAARLVAQVAAALAAAHRRDLIHRDVKPANVLIDAGGEHEHAYLTDFGIARHSTATSGLTHTGAVIGTMDYLAPERIQAGGGDGRSDVYALGCVLYETLTGQRPFERDNDVAKMYAHLSAPVPSALEVRPELAPELDEVAQRAMAKDPDDRFSGAGEMAAALTDTLPSRPVTAPSPLAETVPEETAETLAEEEVPPTQLGATRAALPGQAPTARAAPGGPAAPATPPPATPPPATPPPPAPPAATPPPAPPAPRRRLPVAAIAVVVVAVAGAGLAFALAGGGDSDDGNGSTGSTTQDTQTSETGGDEPGTLAFQQTADIPIPAGADGMAVGEGSVWVANKESDQVIPIPVNGTSAGEPIAVGDEPDSVAVGFGSVWVSNTSSGDVSRIDPESGEEVDRIATGAGPEGVAVSDDAVWVANLEAGTVTRISPKGVVEGTSEVGAGPVQLAVADDGVWVTLSEEDRVVELDLESGEPTGDAVDVAGQPRGIAFGDGRIWVSALQEAQLTIFDPSDTGDVETLGVPAGPRELRFGLGAMWLNSSGPGRLTAIDPESLETVGRFNVGKQNYGLAVNNRFAWASSLEAQRVIKVAPK